MRLIDLDAFWNYVRSHKINFGKYQHDLLNKHPTVQAVPIDVLDKIIDEVCDIDDEIVLNPDSLFERKAYVRAIKVIDIIDKYKAESEDKE